MFRRFASFIVFLLIDWPSGKNSIPRVSEYSHRAIVIAPLATVVISGNSCDPRDGGESATSRPLLQQRVICCWQSSRIEPWSSAPCRASRASDNIRAASVMRERSSASVILRGNTADSFLPVRVDYHYTWYACKRARSILTQHVLRKYSNFSSNIRFFIGRFSENLDEVENMSVICIYHILSWTKTRYFYRNDSREKKKKKKKQ